MKLLLDKDGHAVLRDGLPVYVHDDGKEIPFDAAAAMANIGRLNSEAKENRLRAEKAEGDLRAFEGIADPEAARKALNTVKNLDDKKLVDAGKVEEVKNEVNKAWEAKYAAALAERDTVQGQLHGELIGGAFARSKFIAEKLAIPADIVQATFGGRFKLEGGKVVAYDAAGNKLHSRVKPGEVADFDEALSLIVDSYANKDAILKSGHVGGTGATGGPGGKPNGTGGKQMTRAQFDALDATGRMEFSKAGGVTVDQ